MASMSYVVPNSCIRGSLSTDAGQPATPTGMLSWSNDARSALTTGDPSTVCIASTSPEISRYTDTAFCGSYPWSLTDTWTLRPHTPPAAFCCFQYSCVPCTTLLLNGANTAVRSTRLPSLMVVAVTPGPVLTPPELWSPDVALLHAVRIRHRAVPTASVRFIGRLLDGGTGTVGPRDASSRG